VYLDRDARGRGLGAKLYGALMALLRLQGVRTAYGVVTQPNGASDRLHTAMGFTVAGVVHNAGYKNGRWHDVTTYEKLIGDFDGVPEPLKGIRDVDPAAAAWVLEEGE